jgi:DNA repair exonuclease SbcCD nuclease subunit
LYFVKQATQLREAGIPLYLIAGNHDAANRMTRSLRLPDNVTLFSADSPETAIIDELEVAIHGQSFATAAVYDDLSESYPPAKPGFLNIGLLHTCATGREGYDPYAPCTLEGLRLKGYDYWALGHVHTRETLSDEPLIAFPGNIQGRHIRETGPKGCLLVTVDGDRSLTSEFRPLDVLRWERAALDIRDAQGVDDVLDLLSSKVEELYGQASGRPLALRVELEGASPAHRDLLAKKHHWTNEIRSVAIEAGRGEVWVEKVKVRTTAPLSKDGVRHVPDGAIGELTGLFAEARSDLAKLAEVDFDLSDVVKKLPSELKDAARSEDPEWLQSVLAEAESRLVSQLLESEEAE